MAMQDDTLAVKTHDGGSMPAFVARPASGQGPGIVLLQEIFGITDYIKSRARDLANLGYVVVVPELYWRLGSNISTDETTETGLQQAYGHFSKLDLAHAVDDAVAAVEHVATMPETRGQAGVLGFCLGGRLAYEVGVHGNPDMVVAYYGSGTADRLEDAPKITCPVIFHFGEADPYLPAEQAERIRAAFSARPNAEVHMHAGAGHAFDNHRAPMFYYQPASAESWPQTTAFLQRNYPPGRQP